VHSNRQTITIVATSKLNHVEENQPTGLQYSIKTSEPLPFEGSRNMLVLVPQRFVRGDLYTHPVEDLKMFDSVKRRCTPVSLTPASWILNGKRFLWSWPNGLFLRRDLRRDLRRETIASGFFALPTSQPL
jgi:hypothetical protein